MSPSHHRCCYSLMGVLDKESSFLPIIFFMKTSSHEVLIHSYNDLRKHFRERLVQITLWIHDPTHPRFLRLPLISSSEQQRATTRIRTRAVAFCQQLSFRGALTQGWNRICSVFCEWLVTDTRWPQCGETNWTPEGLRVPGRRVVVKGKGGFTCLLGSFQV